MALTTVPASLSATAITLTTAAQPNITSVGTLTGLTVSGNIAGTLTTAAQPNITSLGTLTALTVDNVNINGDTITTGGITINGSASTISDSSDFGIVSGGDLTMDVAGNIILDADGAIIKFQDGGTDIGSFQSGSQNLIIRTAIADKGIYLQGYDGDLSTLVTALTLDMSEAGAATFNAGVTATRFDATTASTTDPVLQLTDSGVADYDFTFPDTSTIQLGTSTTSDKTFKLLNSGSGTFNLNVEGISTFGTGSYTNSQYYASDVVINAANEGGLTIANSANSHASYIMFADGVSSGSEQYAGYIEYNHSVDRMRVKSNGTFQIYATGLGGDALTIASAGAATFGSRINFAEHIIGSTSGGYLQMRGTSSRYWAIGSTGGNAAPTTASATLGFHHYDGSSWTQNKINITASGKLGVGTDNPDGDLHIQHGSTNTFTASNDSWHTMVIHNNAAAATNTTGIALEVSGSNYHGNAGTGIAAVKNGTNSDYGADLTFINRPQSSVALERYRIKSTGRHLFYGMNSTSSVGSWAFGHTAEGNTGGYMSSWTTVFGQRIHLRNNNGSNTSSHGTTSFSGSSANNFRIMQNMGYNGVYWNASTDTGRGTTTEVANGNWYWSNTNSVASGAQYTTANRMHLNASGNLYITGSLTQNTTISDARLKQDIEEFPSALEKMKALRTVKFNWIDEDRRGEYKEIGLIAQEVKEIYPELIGTTDSIEMTEDPDTLEKVPGEKRYMMHYEKLTVVLLKAMQEQQELIETLQTKVAELEAK